MPSARSRAGINSVGPSCVQLKTQVGSAQAHIVGQHWQRVMRNRRTRRELDVLSPADRSPCPHMWVHECGVRGGNPEGKRGAAKCNRQLIQVRQHDRQKAGDSVVFTPTPQHSVPREEVEQTRNFLIKCRIDPAQFPV